MKYFYAVVMAVVYLMGQPVPAKAGLLDTLNNAAKKVNEVSQQKRATAKPAAGEDPDRPLHLEDHDKTGSCEGKRSATCMDYMELADNCMAPLKGYRMKLTGDLIENKLKTEHFSDRKRQKMEEELAAVRQAEKNKAADQNVSGLSQEDQICINADYNVFYKKIYNKCMGADHMGTGKRTEMMQGEEPLTCQQALAFYREKQKKEEEPFNCLKGVTTLRFAIMADMMEKKMNSMKLSSQERADWEADIASIRELPGSGAMMPKAVDPKNPARAMMRLTTEEQTALGQEYSKQSQAKIEECQKSGPASNTGRAIKSGGLVDRSKSPANKNAQKMKEKEYADLNAGRGGSTNLLALRRDQGCDKVLIGNLAKLTAEKLQEKLNAAKGVSGQQRKEWEEDIAVWRTAAAEGKNSADSPGADPYRWQDRMSKAERAAINKEHLDLNNKVMKECNSKPSGL